jgi:TetR/AcrR family transcriptional regulator, regulator of cefoperazone and chloramphenicol sensitivity
VSAAVPKPVSAPESQDATRVRLLEAAGPVFAEHGYQAATVREICARAGANVAAVNYYFRDKAGLYLEVIRYSLSESGLPEPREAVMQAKTPQEELRMMIGAMLRRMYGVTKGPACHFRIMVHEMAQPTEALPGVVKEIMEPNYEAMRGILGRLLGKPPGDDVTRLYAHSIIAQIVHYAHARPVINLLWPELKLTPERLDAIAAHISAFSLQAIEQFGKTNPISDSDNERTKQ